MQRINSILCLVPTLLVAAVSAWSASPTDMSLSLKVGAQDRTAYLHVPANFDLRQKHGLVIGYHGGAGNARGYIEQSQLFAKGEQAGLLVVCPEGTSIPGSGDHRVWNSGPEYARSSREADDVLFTKQLIEKIGALYPIDQKRIYATGFSNGAQMAYRVALELSDTIAATAPMSGGRLADGRRPSRPVPVLHVHGTADGVYPISGGLGPYSIGNLPHVSISSVVLEWCRFNGARLMPQTASNEGWEMRIHNGTAPVVLVLVNGMGHQIAGGSDDRLPHQVLKSSPDAIELALKFWVFSRICGLRRKVVNERQGSSGKEIRKGIYLFKDLTR